MLNSFKKAAKKLKGFIQDDAQRTVRLRVSRTRSAHSQVMSWSHLHLYTRSE